MIEARFFSDINFSGFLEDAALHFGAVPGSVDQARRSVVLTLAEFADCEADMRELVRDYGGQITHRKTV